MTSLFDNHHSPLPRFYELMIDRRAQAIQEERTHVWFARKHLTPYELFKLKARALASDRPSVAALDFLDTKRSNKLYQRILMGE